MLNPRNINYVLVGKDLAFTSALRTEDMLSGEIAISNVFGTVLTSGTGVTSFMIHQGNKKRLTDVIKKSNIISVNAKGYDAATEQVDFIGYNGTSGAIVAANETDYFVRMNFVYGERGQEFPQQNFLLNHYKSDASATQIEIAKNLSLVMNAQARKRYERDFKVEIICDNAGAAITGTATTWTVSQDSKTIALDGTVTNVVAGDFVRLGGLTVGDPIYQVASVASPTSITLTEAYVGASAALTEATAVEVITAVQADAANVGLKITGIARKFELVPGVRYRKAKWLTSIDGFGSTLITNSVAAYAGNGVYEQVAEEDMFGDIVMGNKYREDIRFPRNLYAEVGGQYGIVTITWEDKGNQVIGPQMSTRKVARVMFNDQTSAQAVEFLATLGEIMGTTYSFA